MDIALRVSRFYELLANGQQKQAIIEIAQAQEHEPVAEAVWLFLTGVFFLQEGFAGRALQAMNEALRIEPQSREFLYGVALANSALGFYQEVLFCAKISSSTREIAQEKRWGNLLTDDMRSIDHLLVASDTNSLLLRVQQQETSGNYLAAALIAEDGLLVFEQSHAWRRAAISAYLLANRPFAAASLLDIFVNTAHLSLDDQVLVGKVFAALGQADESIVWFAKVAEHDNKHRANCNAFARTIACSRPILTREFISTGNKIVRGLLPLPPSKGRGTKNKKHLRVGIVSSDLLIGGLVERVALLFEMFSQSNIEFFLYIDSNSQDSLTERFIALSKDNYVIHGIDDRTVAHILREDEIDVMLELDSQGIYRRPNVARLKPASLHVVAFGDPQDAHRWGYDAVLSDTFLSPIEHKKTSSKHDSCIDDTTPCPILRPKHGFLQVEDVFEVQPLKISRRRNVRLGISGEYASLDANAREIIVNLLQQIPNFVIVLDSETIGGERAAAALLALLKQELPTNQHKRIRFVSEKSSMIYFLSQIDIFLDITYPREAYMFWQALRHGLPSLTLEGDRIPSRLSLSVAQQMALGEFCICRNPKELLARMRELCLNPAYRNRFRKALRNKKNPREQKNRLHNKALAVAQALFEGVVVLGRDNRYIPTHTEINQ